MLKINRTMISFTLICFIMSFSFKSNAEEKTFNPPVIFQQKFETSLLKLAWNFDSTLLAIAGGDDSVSVLNVETGKIDLHLEGVKDEIHVVKTIAWSPTQNHLLIANNLTKIWDYSQGDWVNSFEFPTAIELEEYTTEGNVDWHPDGKRFATLFRKCKEKFLNRPGARVEIWDVATASSSQIAGCVWKGFGIVKWNPQGTQLAISGFSTFDKEGFVEDENIEVWDVDKKEQILTISGLKDPSGLAWSPKGDMIAFTTDIGINQFMQIRDVTDGEIVSQTEANLGVYVPLDWHPSENIIATGGQDGSVRIWDALDSSEIIELPVHEDTVNDIGWSPDGSMLASLGRDGRVFIWRASDLVGQDAIH